MGFDKKIYIMAVLIVAGMFMTLLDTTIVDIVLPHMMSAFDVEADDVQWVVTSYMIASAIAMPTVGWLGEKLGHRNTYLLGIGLFTVMSALCGMSPNFESMIVGRVLQGFGEGLAVPMSMALLFEIFPPEKRGLAMGMFALGATFGPSLGPTLGGYLTEHMDWRWVFYVNLLPGLMVVYILSLIMEDDREKDKQVGRFDVKGLVLISISLSALIIGLSKANEWGWDDRKTVTLIYLAIVSAIMFVLFEVRTENPLVKLSLFKFKFYRYPVASLTFFGMGVYASYFLLPLYLERLRHFKTLTAGEILFWPAFATGVFSVVAGILMDRKILTHKTSIVSGIILFIIGTYLQVKLNLDMDKFQIVLYLLPWGIGMGFFFPALSQVSLGNFMGENLRHASALQNLLRLVAGSVGTAISTHILISSEQKHLLNLTQTVSYQSPQFIDFINKLKLYLYSTKSVCSSIADTKAWAIIGLAFKDHASWHSFGDAFIFATFCGFVALIPSFFIEKTEVNVEG